MRRGVSADDAGGALAKTETFKQRVGKTLRLVGHDSPQYGAAFEFVE